MLEGARTFQEVGPLSVEQSESVFQRRLHSLKPDAGTDLTPSFEQKQAMKAMLQRLSPQCAHEMIQFNLKQPKKQAKSCFTQAKKGRAVFTNVQSQGQASPLIAGQERRSPQEQLR